MIESNFELSVSPAYEQSLKILGQVSVPDEDEDEEKRQLVNDEAHLNFKWKVIDVQSSYAKIKLEFPDLSKISSSPYGYDMLTLRAIAK